MLKTLDAFPFEAQPDVRSRRALAGLRPRFVAEAANVGFVGGVGPGKTHLSIGGRYLTLADGLLGQGRPLRRNRRQTPGLSGRGPGARRLGKRVAISEDPPPARNTPAASGPRMSGTVSRRGE